uniref:GAF domain-containing protein n=1 Tax=Roseihalotalea indica TaxID=2867963 RepID=A0AA49GKI1_9BACT|nr:GAF domain-containing protein [Tunicatimonas sp. TK19036]
MNEQERLQELESYHILDTPPEKELEELTQIASAICGTPISLITFLDDHRQWFKSHIGLPIEETPRSQAFCEYALHCPTEVLVVEDSLNDGRFQHNLLVQEVPHIRFYAGAPLTTPNGGVLGTLCVIDTRPRKITEIQKNALQLLAKKAMTYLHTRKLLLDQARYMEMNAARLKKLTDQAPGVIFQLELSPQGQLSLPFLSEGLSDIFPHLKKEDMQKVPELLFMVMHPEDRAIVYEKFFAASDQLVPIDIEHRALLENGCIAWYLTKAQPEKRADGTLVWYGATQNINAQKKHIQTLERILFDISHILRGPITTLSGLTMVMEMEKEMNEQKLCEFLGHIKSVSEKLNSNTRKLNKTYTQQRESLTLQTSIFPTNNSSTQKTSNN